MKKKVRRRRRKNRVESLFLSLHNRRKREKRERERSGNYASRLSHKLGGRLSPPSNPYPHNLSPRLPLCVIVASLITFKLASAERRKERRRKRRRRVDWVQPQYYIEETRAGYGCAIGL